MGIVLVSDSRWKITGCWQSVLKAVKMAGDGLTPQQWNFCNAAFQLECSSAVAAAVATLVWAGQSLGLCFWSFTMHHSPSHPSRRSRTQHTNFIDMPYLLIVPQDTPWSYIYTHRDLSTPQSTSRSLVEMAEREVAEWFLTLKAN